MVAYANVSAGEQHFGLKRMKQENDVGPIRLVSLLSAIEGIDERVHANKLLDLCIEKLVKSYFSVPPGHAAVVYRLVNKQKKQLLFGPDETIITLKKSPAIIREIKRVGLDPADLRNIRDAGVAVVGGFLHGGLAVGKAGLFHWPFEYCVIRKDMPNPFGTDKGLSLPETLLEGLVFPIEQKIRLEDVFVAAEDAKRLRQAVAGEEIQDKWGHKEAAPSVFLIYRAAHEFSDKKHNYEDVAEWLMEHDKNEVFTIKVAEFAGRLIKKDVRIKKKDLKPNRLAIDKISNNEMGKDYSEAVASQRLSLLHLATDCWIHDKSYPANQKALPEGGLDQCLWDLGFDESEKDATTSQVGLLARVIQNQRGRKQLKEQKWKKPVQKD